MTDPLLTAAGSWSPSLALCLEAACARFEAAWQVAQVAGQRPRVEDFLGAVPEPDRPALRAESTPRDAECRRRAGQTPRGEDYRERSPPLDRDRLTCLIAARRTPPAPAGAAPPPPAGKAAEDTPVMAPRALRL